MTNFQASDPGSGTAAGATSFQQPGAAPAANSGPEDTTVVLELNGRKFTKADLIKKIGSADTHIETLKGELAEQRKILGEVNESLKKQVTTAELLKQIKDQQAAPAADPNAAKPAPQSVPTSDDITKQVMDKIEQGRNAAQRDQNWNEVTSALTQAFGDATNQKVSEAAADAGLSLEEAAELARSKPKAFLKLFPDLSSKAKPSALPSSGKVNTQSFQAQQKGPPGFSKATSTKQSVEIYLNRLKELGL